MSEFSSECEIVGIDRLGVSCEAISSLVWKMSNDELGLREVLRSQQCKIARILVWDVQERIEIEKKKCEKEYEMRAKVNDDYCMGKIRCWNEIKLKVNETINKYRMHIWNSRTSIKLPAKVGDWMITHNWIIKLF